MVTTSPKNLMKESTNLQRSRAWLTYENRSISSEPGHRNDRARWPETRDLELLVA